MELKRGTTNHKEHVIGISVISSKYELPYITSANRLLPDSASQYQLLPSPSNRCSKIRRGRGDSLTAKMIKLAENMDIFAQRIREHGRTTHINETIRYVRLGPKLSETVKGKLIVGARILQVGGVEKIFKQKFNIKIDEKLLKASHCYLSTTNGPIAGLLFVSNHRVAFCSDRPIKCSSANGNLLKLHYKVTIPLRKIKTVNESESVINPKQKYVQLVTEDDYDFWFMGLLTRRKTVKYLQMATNEAVIEFGQEYA